MQINSPNGQPSFPDIVGAAEAAAILGVSRQRVFQLRTERSDFPRPMVELAATPVWMRSEIEKYALDLPMRAGKPPAGRKVWRRLDVDHAPETASSDDRRCLCGEEYEEFGKHLAAVHTAQLRPEYAELRQAQRAVTDFFEEHGGAGKQFGPNELTPAEHALQNELMERLGTAEVRFREMRKSLDVPRS